MCVCRRRGERYPQAANPGGPELLCDIFASITRSNVRASSRRSRGRAATSRASRANHLILPASPISGLGPHISTPLCKNVAVHHSKNCALMSLMGLVSRVTPVHTAVRNCTRDEGRSFEVGNQVLISSHRKLLLSKAMVVNVAEKSKQDFDRHD
jgi:hypothetical protein